MISNTKPDKPRLELWLRVRGGQGPAHEVLVQANRDSTVREMVDGLSASLGFDRALDAFCLRRSMWIDDAGSLDGSGLRHGDTIVLSRQSAVREWDSDATRHVRIEVADLEVVGGPFSGQRYGLIVGEHILGRSPESDLLIEDPSLSAQHARLVVTPDGVEVYDLGSTNGTSVDGTPLATRVARRLRAGEVVMAGRTLFTVNPEPRPRAGMEADGTGSVAFNRSPRIDPPHEAVVFELPRVPDEPHKATLPLSASLAPLVLGGVLYFVVGPAMLIFTALSPVMMLATFVEERRSGKTSFKRKSREFQAALAQVDAELGEAESREADRQRRAAPPAAELLERARGGSDSLWERGPDDHDFLHLRIGSGRQPSGLQLRLESGGSEMLRKQAEDVAARHATVSAVPVLISVADAGVIGVSGPRGSVDSLARFFLGQAATLHSPRELVLCAAVADESDWSWLKWLPHSHSDSSPLLSAHLAAGEQASRDLMDSLQQLLGDRKAQMRERPGSDGSRQRPFVVVLVDESVAPERSRLTELLTEGREHGIGIIWLGSRRQALPHECGSVVELDPHAARLTLSSVGSGHTISDVTADGLSPELALELALALAPLRDVGAAVGRRQIPARVSLLGLLAAEELSVDWIVQRWAEHGDSLSAPVGVTDDRRFDLDLRKDGPHALIAGTTGSGKSELLQTFIASIACSQPPDRTTFLLVDYKGGTALSNFKALPHTVGFVTDLDAHLTHRALVSLNAELRRREEILGRHEAKDLRELERRNTAAAPPSLVIVIDEFATLANEVPEFVNGVVDVAQRGRSLGVHLVLATQRPAGVVTDNIRANTNLRIALRVSDATDSSDVIGSADAARIPRELPGRAFARVGHNELTEFQAAYVGGRTRSVAGGHGVIVSALGFAGPVLGAGVTAASRSQIAQTDLLRIVALAGEAATSLGIGQQRAPWLPSLAELVPLASLAEPGSGGGERAAIGVIDEPALQRQRPCVVDFEADGNMLVFGASGSGKTVLLRTIGASLARDSSPADVQLYCLDFATRGLAPLEALPHCGSVIVAEDEERVERLFSVLRKTLARRRELFASRGVSSLAEYQSVAAGSEPRIVVLLDGYAGFAGAFERVNQGELLDTLPRLAADGRPLGIHFVITADRRGAVPGSLLGIVQRKIVLRMAEEDEYLALGVDRDVARGAQLPPGRGFVDNRLEFQCAIVGMATTGEGQSAVLAQLGAELSVRFPSAKAPGIELLPPIVAADTLPPPGMPLSSVIGIGDENLEPVVANLAETHFLITGPYRSGRSNALGVLAQSLRRFEPSIELHLLAPRRSPLTSLDVWHTAASGVEECTAAAAELAGNSRTGSFVVFVDDGTELLEGPAASALEELVRVGRDGAVRVVAAAEVEACRKAWSGWLRELRKDETGLLLSPQADVDGELLGVRLPRRSATPGTAGRGYLVQDGKVELIQVARA